MKRGFNDDGFVFVLVRFDVVSFVIFAFVGENNDDDSIDDIDSDDDNVDDCVNRCREVASLSTALVVDDDDDDVFVICPLHLIDSKSNMMHANESVSVINCSSITVLTLVALIMLLLLL